MSPFTILLLLFVLSQLYWAWRGYRFAARRIPSRTVRFAVCAAVAAAYFVLYKWNLGTWRATTTPIHLTVRDALSVPFLWWAPTSMVAFLIVLLFAIPRGIAAGFRRIRSPELPSSSRRGFLERTATVATAAPFAAGAYGLLYGRLN